MSTPALPDLDVALSALPSPFRERLLSSYRGVRAAYSNGDYDAAGLRAGVFAETLLRFLQEYLTGNHIPFGSKIPNFSDECRKLEQVTAASGPESLRVLLPRSLAFMYTLRNKRGIGHAGGEVDANQIDAATCARIADWCVCELIRQFGALSLEEAQAILDAIATRQLPLVWSVGGKRRVLDPSLDAKEQTLVLLYGDVEGPVAIEDLCDWVEYSRLDNFRTRVLVPLHNDRLIEWDRESLTATISPRGSDLVEREILPKAERNRGRPRGA